MNNFLSGKVRELFDVGEHLIILTTDRISAFDVILPTLIPDKGKILNSISRFWFEYTEDIIPNHFVSANLSDYPAEFQSDEFDGRSMLVRKLKMLPLECIVSGYLTGSNYKNYKKHGEICGVKIPQGMQESEKFIAPLFCPSTKAEIGEHDEYVTFEYVQNKFGAEIADKLRAKSIAVYEKCAKYALERGIIIADTKFEFGIDENGELRLADEVLTPDSSRFWALETYEVGKSQTSFDKQFLRDWLTEHKLAGVVPPPEIPPEICEKTRAKYIEAAERIGIRNFLIPTT